MARHLELDGFQFPPVTLFFGLILAETRKSTRAREPEKQNDESGRAVGLTVVVPKPMRENTPTAGTGGEMGRPPEITGGPQS